MRKIFIRKGFHFLILLIFLGYFINEFLLRTALAAAFFIFVNFEFLRSQLRDEIAVIGKVHGWLME